MEPDTPRVAFDVEDLLTRCLGKIDFAQRVLARFQERCEQDLADLEQAMAAGQSRTVADLAHRIKGASANAGAPGMRALAAQIEDAAGQCPAEQASAQLAKLKSEWSRFIAAARPFVTTGEKI